MKELFKDILAVDGVEGVVLFSAKGEIQYSQAASPSIPDLESKDWTPFIRGIGDVREADLAFDKLRLYLRRTDSGFLVVVLDFAAPMAMVRLNCDILLPGLKEAGTAKGFGRIFKIKK